jgi:hypothetical protein
VADGRGAPDRAGLAIESTDGAGVRGMVDVSENVIEASWLARADSFHYFPARS